MMVDKRGVVVVAPRRWGYAAIGALLLWLGDSGAGLAVPMSGPALAGGAGAKLATPCDMRVDLPAPPADITPMTGDAHRAALNDPLLRQGEKAADRHDDIAAAYFYRQAADHGNPVARFLYGRLLERGQGISPNRQEAMRQWHLAALAGYAPAQTYLGDRYATGTGVNADIQIAYRWFHMAALAGEDIACSRLAFDMVRGVNLPRNVKDAIHLLRFCAEPVTDTTAYHPSGSAGGPESQTLLAALYVDGVAGELPPDHAQGMMWLKRAAEQHSAFAEETLSVIYAHGVGLEHDAQKAAYWLARSKADADKAPDFWMVP